MTPEIESLKTILTELGATRAADAIVNLERRIAVFEETAAASIKSLEKSVETYKERLAQAMKREEKGTETLLEALTERDELRKQIASMEEHPDVKARKFAEVTRQIAALKAQAARLAPDKPDQSEKNVQVEQNPSK